MGEEWPTGKGWKMFQESDAFAQYKKEPFAGWESIPGAGWVIACKRACDGSRFVYGCPGLDRAVAESIAQNWAHRQGEFADEPEPKVKRIVLGEGTIKEGRELWKGGHLGTIFSVGGIAFDAKDSTTGNIVRELFGCRGALVLELLPAKPCSDCNGTGTVAGRPAD